MSSLLKLKENLFELPSQGVSYDLERVPLVNGDSVVIRPLTVGDQRHMAAGTTNSYQSYHTLLKRILVEPKDLVLDDLLLDDIYAMLLAIRIVSFGRDFDMGYQCEGCGAKVTETIDLNEMQVQYAEDIDDFRSEELTYQLGGKDVVYHLARLKDEKIIDRNLKSLRRNKLIQNDTVDKMYVRFAHSIDTIDGEELGIDEKMRFLDSLSSNELRDFSEEQDSKSCGLVTEMFCDCPKCGYDNEVRFALSPQFFRPR